MQWFWGVGAALLGTSSRDCRGNRSVPPVGYGASVLQRHQAGETLGSPGQPTLVYVQDNSSVHDLV